MKSWVTLSWRRLRLADEGQALVLTALGLMILLMMAALGLDVGYLHFQKQQMQKAADAAAIAAATALSYNGDFNQAGLNDAASNGFTNNPMNGVTVTVNNPPTTPGDPFFGNNNYVEVIVAKTQPTFFMNVDHIGTVNLRSRAVANAFGNASGCIYALDPGDSGTLLVDGNVSLGSTCGIYVESNSSTALIKNGQSGTINVSAPVGVGIGIVGSDPGYTGSPIMPTPVVGIPVFTDPLGSVPAPTVPSGCAHLNFQTSNGNGGAPIRQGTYCGGITVTGNGTLNLMPGTYFLKGGGLSVAGTAGIAGSGVTFYLTSNNSPSIAYQGVSLQGNSTTNLSAPTTGALAGILFFQDRSVAINLSPSSFDGSSGATFVGALYFPTTTIQFKGTPGAATYAPIVAYEIEFKGDATLKAGGVSTGLGAIPGAILVE